MQKVDIFLKPTERAALEQFAQDDGIAVSDVVRNLIRERISQERRLMMRAAAKRMAHAYQTDRDLTAFSDLDCTSTE